LGFHIHLVPLHLGITPLTPIAVVPMSQRDMAGLYKLTQGA
jgi:hypothetical protein